MNSATLVALALASASCTVTHYGRLTGPLPVGDAPLVLEVDSHRSGKVMASLKGGERCQGSFNTVAAELDWDPDEATTDHRELSQVGMLVLVCPQGRVVRCDFSRGFYGPGSGLCRDGSGQDYTLQLL